MFWVPWHVVRRWHGLLGLSATASSLHPKVSWSATTPPGTDPGSGGSYYHKGPPLTVANRMEMNWNEWNITNHEYTKRFTKCIQFKYIEYLWISMYRIFMYSMCLNVRFLFLQFQKISPLKPTCSLSRASESICLKARQTSQGPRRANITQTCRRRPWSRTWIFFTPRNCCPCTAGMSFSFGCFLNVLKSSNWNVMCDHLNLCVCFFDYVRWWLQ